MTAPAPAADAPRARKLQLPRGGEARVLEKGEGLPLCFLGGLRGLPRWPAFLDRLAERRRVIAPSLPGFPGADGHHELDDVADWVAATLDLLEAAGAEGADLVGASPGALLAAEAAAFSRASVRRLVLISPFGLFDAAEPVRDVFALRKNEVAATLCADPRKYEAFVAKPDGEDEIEWQVMLGRAEEAAARLLWPTGDLGLARRLHRIVAPTLIVVGAQDRVLPASYAKRFADGLGGLVQIRGVEGAGHMAELDAPDAVADAVLAFLG